MRFNCARMEVLATGQICSKPSTFEASVLDQGSFKGQIKRTGFRTKHLGPVDLYLVEATPYSAEQLAICYADEAPSEAGNSLVFPLIRGQEFGSINRHGNILTIQALRLVLTLESLADSDDDGDRNLSRTAGKWSRILSRLISPRSTPQSSFQTPSGMDGLGICVPPSATRVRQPAFAMPVSDPMPVMPATRSRQLVPSTMQPSVATSTLQPLMELPTLSTGMTTSKSMKRISLVIGSENGFGDDLKNILTKMDGPEVTETEPVEEPVREPVEEPVEPVKESVEEPKEEPKQVPKQETTKLELKAEEDELRKHISSVRQEHAELQLPNAPFNFDTDSDFSVTPSPTSLYLHSDGMSTSSLNSPDHSKRVDSILAKEQRQYAEKYGSRASTLSDFYTVKTSSTSEPPVAVPNARVPPKMPAPVPEVEGRAGSSRQTEQRASESRQTPSTKTESTRKLKTVSISQDIKVINENDQRSSEDSARPETRTETRRSFARSPVMSWSPLTGKTQQKSSGPNLAKVMKKLLGGKKKSKTHLGVPHRPMVNDASPFFEEDEESSDELNQPPTPMSLEENSQELEEEAQAEQAPATTAKPAICVSEGPESVFAKTTSTGSQNATTAVPRIRNSCSALSFRSLSARSISSSGSETMREDDEQLNRQRIVEEEDGDVAEQDTPTQLRRETRDNIAPIPIKIELDSVYEPPMPAMKRMYETGNKSTSALQHSQSSSYSSFESSRPSLSSLTSSSSMSSSVAGSCSPRKDSTTMFSANMWASVWSSSKWTPLSQLELPTEVIACDSTARLLVNGGASVNFKFTAQCEMRRVSVHDVEIKSPDATYMFRGRDADYVQRFYRLLWSIQTNGVQPVLSALVMSGGIAPPDEQDAWASRRRTLMPPVLSKSNPNLSLSYMGRLTSTIIEE